MNWRFDRVLLTRHGQTQWNVQRRRQGQLDSALRFPGGESYRDAATRAARALELVNATGATLPAVVTHEMIGRLLLAALIGLGPIDALAFELPHGSVLEVSPATADFTLHPAGGRDRSF